MDNNRERWLREDVNWTMRRSDLLGAEIAKLELRVRNLSAAFVAISFLTAVYMLIDLFRSL